ncbi:MAG: RNA methyltransferase [Planctomycetota bacterium]|nr:RNA methyltransferase [Planctomycetota bacterium]MCX8039740.1 RNA methyltransferase [Planctomycetota bacterium]MDW8373234.1 RNA methyltransferase [Planctomycetota bacterium]
MRAAAPGNPARLRRPLPSPVPPHPLDARITAERARNYRQVLARRVQRLVVVVEDCFDPHNATAILRTCDACGIHRVLVTTARNAFRVSERVSQGVERYLDLRVLPGIEAAADWLRARGYRIIVSDLAAEAVVGPQALRAQLASAPLAVVFGNEGHGISERARALADGCFLLPMCGFAQSLNLSVSVAMTLQALRGEELAADAPGDLPAEEQIATYDLWVRRYCGEAAPAPAGAPATDHRGAPVIEYRA